MGPPQAPAPIRIRDPSDERISDYRDLTDAELRRRLEQGEGMFVAEGKLVVRRLLASRYPLRSVLVTPAGLGALEADLAGRPVTVYLAEREVMAATAGFDVHRGVLAAASRLPLPGMGELLGRLATRARLAVVEDLNDHENLGALFRNAAAFGVDAVLLSPRCADPLYRRSVRVSMGTVLSVPYATVPAWPGGLADLRAGGFTLVALSPDPDGEPIDGLAAAPPRRLALVVGAEGPGLSAGALAACDRVVRIPMARGVDSLNVATAAAVAFHRVAALA